MKNIAFLMAIFMVAITLGTGCQKVDTSVLIGHLKEVNDLKGYAVLEGVKIIDYNKEGEILSTYLQRGEVLKSAANPASFPFEKFHFKVGKDVKVKMKKYQGNNFKIISVEEN